MAHYKQAGSSLIMALLFLMLLMLLVLSSFEIATVEQKMSGAFIEILSNQ